MKKYNIRLSKEFSQEIEHTLNENSVTIRHIDHVLKDLIVVEVDKEIDLSIFSFIRSVKETRVGYLLDIPKKENIAMMKATPLPNIETNLLRERGLYGLGNKVAVIDSGYSIEACGEVKDSKSFTSDANDFDVLGHGSLVITLLKRIIPAAQIYSAKVCIEKNTIDEEDVFRALDWIDTELKDVKIINLSLGMDANCLGDCDLAEKINVMVDMGYTIICAMGNKETSTAHCPACAEKAISVGALDVEGTKVASFSSSGHTNSIKPDLVAPGHGSQTYRGQKHQYHGTSFAAPIVTAIVGATYNMYKDQFKVKEYLIQSCDSLLNETVRKQGYGSINLQKLLEVIDNDKKNESESE